MIKKKNSPNLFCKIVTFLLVLSLLTSIVGCGFVPSYQGNASKYANKDFNSMEYRSIDGSRFKNLADEIKELSSNALNSGKVVDKYTEMLDIYSEAYTMYTICYIRNKIDVTDQYYIDELAHTNDLIFDMKNTFEETTKVLHGSKCKSFIELYMGESVWEYYLPKNSTDDVEGLSTLVSREQELINEYNIIYAKEYTVNYNGKDYTLKSLESSLYELGEEKYYELALAITKQMNAEAGEVYIELLKVRNQIAQKYGYETYAEYKYGELSRDYTPEDAQKLSNSVKEKFTDVYNELNNSLNVYAIYEAGEKFIDMPNNKLLELSKITVQNIYPGIGDAFDFMSKNNLINIGNDTNRMDTSFVTWINGYEVPFLFATTEGSVLDFQTIMHEFGHYSAYYNYPGAASSGTDIAEVHSQGLEVLSWHYYDDVFGEEYSHEVYKYMVKILCESIVLGCMFDDFQQKVYAMDEPTLSEINKLYFDLCNEYGVAVYDNGSGEAYSWVETLHNFIAPYYYISYAVSAMVSLELWTIQLENPEKAVNFYLDYVKNSSELTELLAVIDASGFSSPFERDTVDMISEKLEEFVSDAGMEQLAA